jgi:hypothetical protein
VTELITVSRIFVKLNLHKVPTNIGPLEAGKEEERLWRPPPPLRRDGVNSPYLPA